MDIVQGIADLLHTEKTKTTKGQTIYSLPLEKQKILGNGLKTKDVLYTKEPYTGGLSLVFLRKPQYHKSLNFPVILQNIAG
jgi:hypothetical protein